MIVNPIENGIVIDHIKSGGALEIYDALHLGDLDCTVAMIRNADSRKMGKKDILKVFEVIDINLDVLGYLDPDVTVSVIKNGSVEKRIKLSLPEKVFDIIKCKNPRCITAVEQELPQIFKLTDAKTRTYRCLYCETRAKEQ